MQTAQALMVPLVWPLHKSNGKPLSFKHGCSLVRARFEKILLSPIIDKDKKARAEGRNGVINSF